MTRADIVILVLLSLQSKFAAIVAVDPATLGIPHVAVAWVAVMAVPVGVILNQLRALGTRGGG